MKKLTLGLFSFLFIFLISFSPSLSAKFNKYIIGKIKVIDGDTIMMDGRGYNKIDGDTIKMNGKRIRLFGIDAPEKDQICVNKNSESYNCGSISTKVLKRYVGREKIKCRYTEKDRYGRILGTCYFPYDSSKLSLNRYMVHTGNATAYKRYSKKYLDSEKWAKDNHLGIWQGNFERPEKWRRKYK